MFDLLFDIQARAIDVSPKKEGYVCVNFVVRKRDSSKTKVRNIKITQMWMLVQVARHLVRFTLMKTGSE